MDLSQGLDELHISLARQFHQDEVRLHGLRLLTLLAHADLGDCPQIFTVVERSRIRHVIRDRTLPLAV